MTQRGAPTRLIILAPHLRGLGGHHLTICSGLVRAARGRGLDVNLVVERDALTPALRAQLGALDLLPPSAITWELPGNPARADYGNARVLGQAFAQDARALDALLDDRPTLIVVDGLQPARFYGLAAWLRDCHAAKSVGVLHMAFTFNLFDRATGVPTANRHVYGALLSAIDRPRAQVAVFGRKYADDFEALTGVHAARYPLPMDYDGIPRATPVTKRALTIVINVATPSGIDAAIACISDRFVRRHFEPRLKLTGWGPISLEHRRRLDAAGVPTIERSASRDQYADMFGSEGAMLFAYAANSYRRSSSGVMAEAAAAGLVAVVPAQTWLSDCLEEGLAAGVTFDAMRGDAFIRAVKEVRRDWDRLSAAARLRADEMRRAHSVEAFLDRAVESFPTILGDAWAFGLRAGERLSFADSAAAHHLYAGWSFAEAWGRWLEGERAALRVCVVAPDETARQVLPRRLHIEAVGLAPADGPQRVDVQCNGVSVGECVFASGGPPREFTFELPLAVQTPDIRMDFNVRRPVRPVDLGLNVDVRRLGFGLIALRVTE